MNKIVKRILWIIVAIIVLLVATWLFYGYPMLLMTPAGTGHIPNTNIYSVKNDKNTVFFIKTDSGYIMLDAASEPKKFETSLKESGIDINDVKWIFISHSDYDHVAALHLFPNAKIYMGEDELPLINGTMKRNIFGGNIMPSGVEIDKIILLSDGQEFLFNGTKIKCIKAPGHTLGSMVYSIDDMYLFTGDAFKMSDGNIDVHPFAMDEELSKKTIEQLKGIINNYSIVLTAHYGVTIK